MSDCTINACYWLHFNITRKFSSYHFTIFSMYWETIACIFILILFLLNQSWCIENVFNDVSFLMTRSRVVAVQILWVLNDSKLTTNAKLSLPMPSSMALNLSALRPHATRNAIILSCELCDTRHPHPAQIIATIIAVAVHCGDLRRARYSNWIHCPSSLSNST